METLSVRTRQKKDIVDLTQRLEALVRARGAWDGVCVVFVTHTTCCLTTGEVGEYTDQDFLQVAEEVIPRIRFRHAHDPSHAWSHMASSLIGPSLAIPVRGGRLALGTWQSVMLVELDGPRERRVTVSLLGETTGPGA